MSKLQRTIVQVQDLYANPVAKSYNQNPVSDSFLKSYSDMFDFVIAASLKSIETRKFSLRPSFIIKVHKVGFSSIDTQSNFLRQTSVSISNSKHEPPKAEELLGLIEDLCEYVNSRWKEKDFIHLSAYFMWRLLWIHPFSEGNGSIARLLAYSIILVNTGSILPGRKILPELIIENRSEYYEALEKADASFLEGSIDVSAMERLIGKLLIEQLETYA